MNSQFCCFRNFHYLKNTKKTSKQTPKKKTKPPSTGAHRTAKKPVGLLQAALWLFEGHPVVIATCSIFQSKCHPFKPLRDGIYGHPINGIMWHPKWRSPGGIYTIYKYLSKEDFLWLPKPECFRGILGRDSITFNWYYFWNSQPSGIGRGEICPISFHKRQQKIAGYFHVFSDCFFCVWTWRVGRE